jgi:arylsulfatase A-like enzyme
MGLRDHPLLQRVQLGNDFRVALVVPPDSEVRIPVDIPPQGTLAYELGVLSVAEQPFGAAARVSVHFLGADGRRIPLQTHHVAARRAKDGSWRPIRLRFPLLEERRGHLIFSSDSLAQVEGPHVAFANPTVHPDRGGEAPNVLLIAIDTLRADHLGAYGYARETTPFLDSLARQSILFEDVLAQSSWTKTAMASLLTSTYPDEHGVRGVDDRLRLDALTMAEVLAERGYFTAAVQSNPWMHPQSQLGQGFAEYHWLGSAAAAEINEAAFDVLTRRRGEPFFLYLHYLDVHHPYTPPDAYRQFGSAAPDLYDGEIRHLDAQLAGLVESLESASLLENTLLVVTSDHGEEFGEHGGRYHGTTLYQEQLRVPLSIRWTGRLEGGRRIKETVRSIDIAPTLLGLMDVPIPRSFQGISRTNLILGQSTGVPSEEPPAFAQVGLNDLAPDRDLFCVVGPRWKYIRDRRSSWRRLFDRQRDPGEHHDVSTIHPQVVHAMERIVLGSADGARPTPRRPAMAAEEGALDPQLTRMLRALGYLGE